MNNVLSLVDAARASGGADSKLSSPSMLTALVALHDDMIEQLRLERLGTVGNASLLTDLIDQHENIAGLLREKLGLQKKPGHAAAGPSNPSPNLTMPSKYHKRPASPIMVAVIKPLVLHDVTPRATMTGNVASQRHILAAQNAPGTPGLAHYPFAARSRA